MSRDVNARRRAIRELISTAIVPSETTLQVLLAQERGFNVTQATISRDLAAVGAVRVRTQTGWRYVLPQEQDASVIRDLALLEINSIAANESIIVIRTRIGHAAGVGVFLDSLGFNDILGTLAGDDAVLVIPRSQKHTRRLLALLRQTIYA